MSHVFQPCLSSRYLWPWAPRGHWRPPGPAAPRSGSEPSRWSADLPTKVTHHQGRRCSWATPLGLGTLHWPSPCDPVPLRSAFQPPLIWLTTWPSVQQASRRWSWRWGTETPHKGWKWSCSVEQQLVLSGGCSRGAAPPHLEINKKKRKVNHAPTSQCTFVVSVYGIKKWSGEM